MLALCALYAALSAWVAVVSVRYYGIVKTPGWEARDARADGWYISLVDAAGPAAGKIEVGDRLVAIDGDERAAVLGNPLTYNVPGDRPYTVDVERRGVPVTAALTMPVDRGRLLWPIFQVVGLMFFVCGAGLALLRPEDPQVRLIGGALMAVAFTTLIEAEGGARRFITGWVDRSLQTLIAALSLFTFPMAFHFFSRFPTWRSPGRAWGAIQWALYLLLAVFVPAWTINFLGYDVSPSVSRWLIAHPVLYLTAVRISARAVYLYIDACLLLAIVAVARNYRRLPDPDSRRRIRWVVAGLVAACVPYVIVILQYRVFAVSDEPTYRFWYPVTFIAMLCIPASIATAVWRDQLFDVRVLVRRGLQYVFARAALRTLLALPVALLLFSILRNPDRTIAEILTNGWVNVALVGAIALTLQSRQRLQVALDRRFFREAYEQEQVLANLIDEVRQRDSLEEIAKLVSARIDSVLHPAALHIFYRVEERSGRFERQSSSDGAVANLPASFDGRIEDLERQWLEQSAAHVVVPITGTRDGLVGVLLLGERKSDEPYSATDRRLLQGIAAQIGLVYENQHLKDRVRKDADVRRDVLARLEEKRVTLLKECPVCGTCYDSRSERCDGDDAELTLTLPIERTLEGKYRLERALGRGGFGAVFAATDLRLQRQVAVKVMMGSLFGDQAALRRFEREARAAARIDHRNITRVHDYGTVGTGGAFLVMELVSGRTWRAELRRSGAVSPLRAAGWFRQLLDGLQFAHALGIVHRDLKPENVMIVSSPSGEDELKIMDFGLAKVLDAGTGATESVTLAGTAMGTLGYMAPELLSGGLVDERADIFAIGVMIVETISGTRPFDGPNPQAILAAVLRDDYHLPGQTPEIRVLDAVVQRCLAKDPRDRYGSVAELVREVIPALARCESLDGQFRVAPPETPTIGNVP